MRRYSSCWSCFIPPVFVIMRRFCSLFVRFLFAFCFIFSWRCTYFIRTIYTSERSIKHADLPLFLFALLFFCSFFSLRFLFFCTWGYTKLRTCIILYYSTSDQSIKHANRPERRAVLDRERERAVALKQTEAIEAARLHAEENSRKKLQV